MSTKCFICKKSIEVTFLDKIKGTYIKEHSKKYPVCSECQTHFKTKEELSKQHL